MKAAIFDVPYSLDYETGAESPEEIIDWGLQTVKWADQYGLSAAFFAEHFTVGREPGPAPELMIAAASQITNQIKLGALGHLLPYHNPISLAHRVLWLDHMTKGRYIAGIAAGAFPTDAHLFDTGDRNGEMMLEALEIISAIWTRPGPWRIEGKYWTADMPEFSETWQGPHLKPRQSPHPRMAMVGMQPNSGSLKIAGSHGFIPVSQMLGEETLCAMWETYSNAASEAGLNADRSDWHIVRDFFVADTDEQAREEVLTGGAGRLWDEHNHPVFTEFGLAQNIGPVDPKEMTSEWMVDNFWIVGSPDTVVEKLTALQMATGGFGTLVGLMHDYRDRPEVFRRNLELMGREVLPRVADLGPAEAEEAAVGGA